LPAFIKTPVRRAISASEMEDPQDGSLPAEVAVEPARDADPAPGRPRRRRRIRIGGDDRDEASPREDATGTTDADKS
jgi:hypothetical protein